MQYLKLKILMGLQLIFARIFDLNGYVTLLEKSKFCFPYLYNVPQLCNIMGSEKVAYTKWGFHKSMICNRIDRKESYIGHPFTV